MIDGRLKTPLFRTDEERGFVFCGAANINSKR